MKNSILVAILVLGSTAVSSAANSAAGVSVTDPTVTCNVQAMGKVDGIERPASQIIATDTKILNTTGRTILRAKSLSGRTEFSVELTPYSVTANIMEPGLKVLAGSFALATVSVGTSTFAQLNAANTPDGFLILKCFGN